MSSIDLRACGLTSLHAVLHVNGTGARYTRSHPPKCLLAVVPYPDRSEASKAEYAIKKLSAIEKQAYALK